MPSDHFIGGTVEANSNFEFCNLAENMTSQEAPMKYACEDGVTIQLQFLLCAPVSGYMDLQPPTCSVNTNISGFTVERLQWRG